MDQNFSSLEYCNCWDFTHVPMPMQCFIHVSQFQEKNPVLPIMKFVSCTRIWWCCNNLSIFLLHYLSSGRLQEVKNKGNFQTFSSKSGCGQLRGLVEHLRRGWGHSFVFLGKLLLSQTASFHPVVLVGGIARVLCSSHLGSWRSTPNHVTLI